jgi:hypothetical protein
LLVVAAALGLPRHAWFSYDSIARTPSSADRLEVSRDGVVVEEDDEVTDAPVYETALGPLVHVAVQLIRTLVAGESLVLTDDADVEELAEALIAALSERDGARPEGALLDCLAEHPMVDEVFADEPTIAAALRSATG